MTTGPLIIVSGPSGSGKSTVIERLRETSSLPLHLSVSATTRAPRPGEKDGVHYHFWTPEQFESEVKSGSFLEWARVHGKCYGTLRREVAEPRARGEGVILDIDVQGASQVWKHCPDAVSVFLQASSMEAYEQRLRKRGTETEEAIERRLKAASGELAHAAEYDHLVINDDLDAAVAGLRAIVQQQFDKGDRNAG
jgi:guanylate kinase